jgi:hypothetical protein
MPWEERENNQAACKAARAPLIVRFYLTRGSRVLGSGEVFQDPSHISRSMEDAHHL